MINERLFDQHGFVLLSGESIIIHGQEGIMMITMKVITGTVEVTGKADFTIGGKLCGAVTFPTGTEFIFGSGESTIDDLTINASSGTCILAGVSILNPS